MIPARFLRCRTKLMSAHASGFKFSWLPPARNCWATTQARLFQYATCRQSHHRRDDKWDVVVVGSGVAGVCASIAAAENGLSVLLIDSAHGGGASILSGGIVYGGGGTKQQKLARYGYDTPENMLSYLRLEVKDAVSEETLRRFCFESVERMEWLEKHGAQFEASMCPYKTSYPTDKHYLYYSGSENAYPFYKDAIPAPRGHRMASPGLSGSQLWRALFEPALRLGVQFQPASRAQKILLDSTGVVEGLECQFIEDNSLDFWRHRRLSERVKKCQLVLPQFAAVAHTRAERLCNRTAIFKSIQSRAIVLAAGGFAFNKEMRHYYLPDYSEVAPLGTPADDGSGIKLGQAVGGSVSHLNRMSAWRFLYPPTALLEGVVVKLDGSRFVAEDVYGSRLSNAMIHEANNKAFLVLDSRQWAKAKVQLSQQMQFPISLQKLEWLYWNHKKASSLEALAEKLKISPNGLTRTVKLYNTAIAEGRDDPLNKTPAYCSSIRQAPFYGIDISAVPKGIQSVMGLTLGGLRVDQRTGLVISEEGDTISGLYAAGRNAVGICSNEYVSGLSLADCVFSGRRAGEHIATVTLRSPPTKTTTK